MDLIRSYEQIKQNLETKKELIVDARPAEGYKSGHILDSVSCPYAELFDHETKTLKSKEKIADCNKCFFY